MVEQVLRLHTELRFTVSSTRYNQIKRRKSLRLDPSDPLGGCGVAVLMKTVGEELKLLLQGHNEQNHSR